MIMTYQQAREIVERRALIGAQAYNQARSPGETRSSRQIFDTLHGNPAHAPLSFAHGHIS